MRFKITIFNIILLNITPEKVHDIMHFFLYPKSNISRLHSDNLSCVLTKKIPSISFQHKKNVSQMGVTRLHVSWCIPQQKCQRIYKILFCILSMWL